MKQYIFGLIILFQCINVQAQDLQTNVEVDGLEIYTFEYGSPGVCFPSSHDVTVQLDDALYPFATGVKIALLVSSYSAPFNTVLVDEVGEVGVGDRLLFSPNQLSYTFRFLEEGSIGLSLIVSGTPLVYQENYFCTVEGTVTEAVCGNEAFLYPSKMEPVCSVSLGTNVIDEISQDACTIYPNPIKEDQALMIALEDANNQINEINIYNINGCLLLQQINNSSKKLSLPYLKDVPKGTYLVQVNTSKGSITKKIVKL